MVAFTLRYSTTLRWVATLGVSAKIGVSMLWRLIHSAVEPDSVSATMAFTAQVVGGKQRAVGDRLVDAA
jgi:hypothetical protein